MFIRSGAFAAKYDIIHNCICLAYVYHVLVLQQPVSTSSVTFHLTAKSIRGRCSFTIIFAIVVLSVGGMSAHKVALYLLAQAQAPLARRTRAPTRVCVCSSGRASAATVA